MDNPLGDLYKVLTDEANDPERIARFKKRKLQHEAKAKRLNLLLELAEGIPTKQLKGYELKRK